MTTTEAPRSAPDDLTLAEQIPVSQPAELTQPAETVAHVPTEAVMPTEAVTPVAEDTEVTKDAVAADDANPAATPRHAAHQALLERNRALKLINSGQATTATVDTLCDTGVRVNGRAVAEIHLLVERPGREPYPVVRSTVMPHPDTDLAEAATASSGRPRRIPVLVDPGRPENVLLRWDLRPAS